MDNPYKILDLPQTADSKEIMKAQFKAMKEKKHSLSDIQMAARQLLDPTKRLVADFMFPTKIRGKRPQKILIDAELNKVSLSDIDENAHDSLS